MNLKTQDFLVVLKLLAQAPGWRYAGLAEALGMGQGEVHAAVRRAKQAQLLAVDSGRPVPMRRNVLEFVEHGIRYVFVPEHGAMTRGMPTAWGATPLSELMVGERQGVPVWPDPEGKVRGESFSPLYRSVPVAARNDRDLYHLLVLVDAVRGGGARERKIAFGLFRERIKGNKDAP